MEGIHPVILIIATLLANLIACTLRSYYGKKVSDNMAGYCLYNTVSGVFTMLTLIILMGKMPVISTFTLWMGIIFGLVTAIQQIINIYAISIGPISLTTVIVTLSTVIPALSGFFFWGESISIAQIFGIVLMLGCFVLSGMGKKDAEEKKANTKWFIASLLASALCGVVGIMQKVHQESVFKGELYEFLIIAFICSALFSGIIFAFTAKKTGENLFYPESRNKKNLGWILAGMFVCVGVMIAFNNAINLFLSGAMDSAIMFPVINGTALILITVTSIILFKERLPLIQWIGMGLGVVATVLLCL